MRRCLAILRKEFRQIRRDPLSLALLVFVPAMLLVLYGYALSFDVKHIKVAVLDQDGTPESRMFLDSLFGNPYFERRFNLTSIRDADSLLAHGEVRAVLNIPKGYAAGLQRGESVSVQVLVDSADANSALTVSGYIDALADRATRQAREHLSGQAPSLPVVGVEPRMWFNPELDSARFLVPGLIGMLLMLSAVIATSLSIVREKEHGTMEQITVSPLRPMELIAGKTLPYVLICFVTMALVLLLGYVLFGVEIRGSLLLLAAATVAFLFAALGMGILVSSVTNSQQMAFQIAIMASLLPSLILSGFLFPIQNMPAPIRVFTFIVVPRYFVAALRQIILKGATLSAVWPDLAAMVALGLVFNLLAARNTRKAM